MQDTGSSHREKTEIFYKGKKPYLVSSILYPASAYR